MYVYDTNHYHYIHHYYVHQDFYQDGEYIIHQGGLGDTFFIINVGSVRVTQRAEGETQETTLRTLGRGDYFGEKALLE